MALLKQQVKQKDYHLAHLPLESICRMVYGTCGTMGLKVGGLKDPTVGLVGGGAGAGAGK